MAISAAVVFTVLLGCTARDRSASKTDSGRGVADNLTCLDAPPLLGLRLGDSVSRLRAAVGEPLDSVRSTDEAGGRREVITYRFPRADVRFVSGYVDRIVASEAGGWPRGLAVGSTRREVDQYTGQHRVLRMTGGDAVTRDTIEIVVCPDNRALLHLTPAAGGWRVRLVELLAGRN